MNCENINKLMLEISASNGLLNRTHPAEVILADVHIVLLTFNAADVKQLESWLGTLDADQLSTLCDGEDGEIAAIVASSPTSPVCGLCVGQMIDVIWERISA